MMRLAARLPMPARAGQVPTWSTAGSRASAQWLADLNIPAPHTRWAVEIALDVRDQPAPCEFDEHVDTRFHLEIYSEEWGLFFCHGGRVSRIRVTDIEFVHGRDDFALHGAIPPLANIGRLLRDLEDRYRVAFRRDLALVLTDIDGAEPAIRAWVQAL